MSGKYQDWETYVTPPVTNGLSLSTPSNQGVRRKLLTATPVEVKLTGDVFLQPPDGAGNQASNDMTDVVMVRIKADKDDVCVLFGAAGAALTPDPTATGSSANVCDIIPNGMFEDYVLSPKLHQSMYVRSRSGTSGAGVIYRLSAPITGSR